MHSMNLSSALGLQKFQQNYLRFHSIKAHQGYIARSAQCWLSSFHLANEMNALMWIQTNEKQISKDFKWLKAQNRNTSLHSKSSESSVYSFVSLSHVITCRAWRTVLTKQFCSLLQWKINMLIAPKRLQHISNNIWHERDAF